MGPHCCRTRSHSRAAVNPNVGWSRQPRTAQGITARNHNKGSWSQTRVTTCKATEITTSPRTPVCLQGFQKAFSDALQPSPASQPEIPPPILSASAKGQHQAPSLESAPHTTVLCCSGLHLRKKPASSRRAFSRAPEAMPGTVTTSKQCGAGSERCSLLFIACIHLSSQ